MITRDGERGAYFVGCDRLDWQMILITHIKGGGLGAFLEVSVFFRFRRDCSLTEDVPLFLFNQITFWAIFFPCGVDGLKSSLSSSCSFLEIIFSSFSYLFSFFTRSIGLSDGLNRESITTILLSSSESSTSLPKSLSELLNLSSSN